MNCKTLFSLCIFGFIALFVHGKQQDFIIYAKQPVKITCSDSEGQVVRTSLEILCRDFQAVLSSSTNMDANTGDIIVGTIGQSDLLRQVQLDTSVLKDKKQAFLLAVSPEGKLIVAGSDKHGTAYGILEISRLLGVSPWEWWADVVPEKRKSFTLSSEFKSLQFPSVEYRGIFINDEDWGLMPWSSQTYEPSKVKGEIGPRTNERIFELLLRLRANTYWPAMHECTVPFFLTKGNREMAEKYGIFMGASHCEPMACSVAGEWRRRGTGEYNYVTNRVNVCKFWEERVKEVADQEIVYTLGMRGVHDGAMQGVKTAEAQKNVLNRIFVTQRGLLEKYVNKDVTKVPQVFIPYKEVLEAYHAGLQVPDDVTLMWCDDNYGYIRHFPTPEERMRKGGNGIYYHISYWGRPHDYLWLGTVSPSLIYQQMKLAYERGIQKMWVLNVGDIKPSEYQIELFMDMAWNMDKVASEGITSHLRQWLEREFGFGCAKKIWPVVQEHYRLAYIRKPEFMGNTRVEESNAVYNIVKDLPWSEREINERLLAYDKLSETVERVASKIPASRQNAYFELVKYPVQAASQMNRKLLFAQLARHGKAEWDKIDMAYDSIVTLTRHYNELENGKWDRMMSFQPRRLSVFGRVERKSESAPLISERPAVYKWNGIEAMKGFPVAHEGLGYDGKAAGIKKGDTLTFSFNNWKKDSVEVDIRLLPNHPVAGEKLSFSVSLDGKELKEVSYETKGRSEEWKENVLRNQAIRKTRFPIAKKKSHELAIKALDEGVVLDQIMLY
ncbi:MULTISPECIES: glycosyl hydrolase 115 family protein [Bacteroides]|uniref:glycosyl hydrolase 115 family protein n=1 Tax=Bacteroides TaxID=816 RepID=UPI00319E4D67